MPAQCFAHLQYHNGIWPLVLKPQEMKKANLISPRVFHLMKRGARILKIHRNKSLAQNITN